ncbi:MAG: MBL fold metallo-hydrolase [Kiritimatiellae bacterium]|nr:MBL fold metallo-hydrolase [Kiritimatiellia bacterium]
MTRKEFIQSFGAAAAVSLLGKSFGATGPDYDKFQAEIDEVTPKMFFDYLKGGPTDKAALRRLDAAFDKVLKEVRETVVTDKPAIWLIYNMGVIVKTKQSCFSIDLKHRRAPEIAPLLDFALITHNHGDHYSNEFYRAMDGAGKTVVSNFKKNTGVKDGKGICGYTRGTRTLKLKDVEIRTALVDHSKTMIDFITSFEIHVGNWLIYHTGDAADEAKLNPSRRPDIWMVHPYCNEWPITKGVNKFHPKLAVPMHLNEFGHPRGHCRWTWADGLRAKADAEKAGSPAIVPVWGDRIF